MEELKREVAHVRIPRKNAIDPEVLRANVGAQILPFWIFRIGRWLDRIRPNVTEAARHANTVWPDQFFVVVVGRIGIEAFRVPLLRGSFIEVWIWKKPKSHDSSRVAVIRACGNILATRSNF